jgi:ABC-type bacteriocin/lantibiotic exporter with double-glycine peptidase domain
LELLLLLLLLLLCIISYRSLCLRHHSQRSLPWKERITQSLVGCSNIIEYIESLAKEQSGRRSGDEQTIKQKSISNKTAIMIHDHASLLLSRTSPAGTRGAGVLTTTS